MRNRTYCTMMATLREILGGDLVYVYPIRYRDMIARTPRGTKVVVVDFRAGSVPAYYRAMNSLMDAFLAAREHIMIGSGGWDEDEGLGGMAGEIQQRHGIASLISL